MKLFLLIFREMKLFLKIFSGMASSVDWVCTVCICHFVRHFGVRNFMTFTVTFRTFVLRFYGPVNPMGSCRAQSVYLTTRLLGRLSPLGG